MSKKKKIKELRDFLNWIYVQYLRVTQRKESVIDVSSRGASGRPNIYVGLGKRKDGLNFTEFWYQIPWKRQKEMKLIFIWKRAYFLRCQIQNLIFWIGGRQIQHSIQYLTGSRYFSKPGVYCFIRVNFQYPRRSCLPVS